MVINHRISLTDVESLRRTKVKSLLTIYACLESLSMIANFVDESLKQAKNLAVIQFIANLDQTLVQYKRRQGKRIER